MSIWEFEVKIVIMDDIVTHKKKVCNVLCFNMKVYSSMYIL